MKEVAVVMALVVTALVIAPGRPVLAVASPSPASSSPRPATSGGAAAGAATPVPLQRAGTKPAASGAGSFPARYVPVLPTRILDTRIGLGGYSRPLGPNSTSAVQVAGVLVVPASGVSAVVINVTVTSPTAQSLLIVYPSGQGAPGASTVNFFAGQTLANLATVNLGPDGAVNIYQANGTAHVILDVEGYYASAAPGTGLYRPLSPGRVLDTRTGNGAAGRLGAQKAISLQVAGRAGVPASGVSAVALNLTAVNGTLGSYLTAFPAGGQPPQASTVNFGPGFNVPNRVIVPLSAGRLSVYNDRGDVDVVADVDGWYTDGSDAAATGGEYSGVVPFRVLDTRSGIGAPRPLSPGGTAGFAVGGVAPVPAGAGSAVLNVTVTNPTAGSVATLYPSGDFLPLASDLNFGPWQTVANMTPVKLGADGNATIWNNLGTTDVIADVEGWFTAAPSPGSPPAAPTSPAVSPTTSTSAAASWSPPASSLEITSYTLILQPGGRQYPVAGGTTSTTLAGLQCGLSYTVQVAATSAAGSGAPSPSVNLTLPACPVSNVIQDVPWIHQQYSLSCEAAALQMVLYHENLLQSQDQILNDLGIDSRPAYRESSGLLRWGDAFQVFVGNPRGAEYNLTGYGTYSPAISRVAGGYGAQVLSAGMGISPATIYDSLMAGHPVIAWTTFNWDTPARRDYLAFDNVWIPYAGPVEHAVAVVGVRPDAVLINDPDRNQYWMSKATFEAVYAVYGDMAVIIR